jgi:AraC-like DNA-binding protein/quercetin dioxygenase-like cupin family protein
MTSTTRKTALTPVPHDASPERPPTAARPVRCRARTLAMDTHIVPHEHVWAQFTYCASGLMQVTVMQGEVQTTFIVPPSRAVWIPPGVQHTVVVLENAELRTVSIAPQVLLPDWTDCRVLVVSPLLREVVQALDGIEAGAREQALIALALDEMHRADTQNLGVPMPHPAYGDKRLRALCEAVLRNPAEKGPLRDWVHQIGASERTMARLFRDELGTSYQQWRLQAILATALPQLARGLPIAQVAAAAGYASDSAFSAMFKQAMGQAPSQFQAKTLSK